MKKKLHNKYQKKINLLHNKLLDGLKLETMPKSAKEWLCGRIVLMESKTYIKSNFDDIDWFNLNGLAKDRKVMDFGAGCGYLSYLLSNEDIEISAYEYEGDWVGQMCDKDEQIAGYSFTYKTINEIEEKIKFNLYKSLPLDEKSGSYDSIVLYAVIEHIDSRIEGDLFAEFRRILKPEGRLYIAKLPRVFSYQEFIARKMKWGSHSNLFSKNKINKLLKKHGFTIEKIEMSGLFFNHPNRITNILFPITSRLEKILRYSPLRLLSHDFRLIVRKDQSGTV
jgi:2-polyprenyl-3-methyl-5-hydroxy-6-metoxy-1,4-benzoquinol methylase